MRRAKRTKGDKAVEREKVRMGPILAESDAPDRAGPRIERAG
jgi:hypothetical protein